MKLKPCPFCGSDDLVPSFHYSGEGRDHTDGLMVCVACEDCDAEGPVVTVDKKHATGGARAFEQAHARWNKRPKK